MDVRHRVRVLERAALAALALCACACARQVRPEPPRDLQAYAGVPLSFETGDSAHGAQYEWAFGDETPPVRGPRATHAFARSGRYTVRGSQHGQIAATFNVTVVPRPVLHAVPPDARAVAFVPRVRDLLVATEFLNRAVGSLISDDFMDRTPLLRYALSMRGASPAELGVDEEEGLALFRWARGWVATAGIADESKALAAARRVFESRGFRASTRGEGTVLLERGRDRIVGLVDRGYLYLASSPEEDDGTWLTTLRQRISAIAPDGISTDPVLAGLRKEVPEGETMVFWREDEIDSPGGVRSGLAVLRFHGDVMEVEGRLHAGRPLWDPSRSPQGRPLERGAQGPVLALSASVTPEELARLLRGRAASASEIDEAARVLEGDLAMVAYFDAGATARAMRSGPRMSAVAGTVLGHAGIRDRAAATRLVESALERSEIRFKKRSARGATVFSLEWLGRPATIEITDRRLSLEAGEPLRDRQGVALAESLQARFVPASFDAGHLSFAVDVGQLSRELDPSALSRAGGAAPILAFLSALIRQATAVETIFVDVAPDDRGGQLRGRVTLLPR